ncbi:carboxyl transferase domain-containing protein [Streptomyces sp. NPDC052023]|uniref:carboxyl transferase domain-containing protein n=1 Tax=Streptomyces sp. NPDC052023 TaxID=3365681 RepID=UPI0037D901E9
MLGIDSSEKAARFVRTCDEFNTRLVTLADVPRLHARHRPRAQRDRHARCGYRSEAPEADHGQTHGRPATPPPHHPHDPAPTPLPVTERHRRTVAHPSFTEVLPGPLRVVLNLIE